MKRTGLIGIIVTVVFMLTNIALANTIKLYDPEQCS